MALIPDEELLVASCHDGNQFTALVDHNFVAVHRYLYRRVGSDLADELAAETFVQAFQHRNRYDPQRGGAQVWLLGIATNLLRHHQRSEQRRLAAYARVPLDAYQEDGTAAVDTRLAAGELGQALGRSLAGMRRQDRDVLLLVAWADLSYAQVAAALDIPIGTVRSRLAHARRHIRKDLPEVNDWSPLSVQPVAGAPKGVVLDG